MDTQIAKKVTDRAMELLRYSMLFIAVVFCSAEAQAQVTLSGRITGHTANASIKITQGGRITFVQPDSSGNWSYRTSRTDSYEVSANSTKPGTRVSPPARAGAGITTGGLDFHVADGFQFLQVYGRVTMNGNGVGGVSISSTNNKIGNAQTSSGGNGEMPVGMYVIDYTKNSTIGFVTITPSKAGVMSFSPSAISVNGDQGRSGANFEIPGASTPPPPAPQPNPAPSVPTHTIRGQVTDLNGNPLAGVQIFTGSTPINVVTDSNGRYSHSVKEGDAVGIAPVYSPHAFSPQSAVFQNGITSDITQNFVGAPLYGRPILSVEPMDQTVNQYYQASFRAQVINPQGGTPIFQWYKNGQPVGGNTSIYSFAAQKSDNGATIRCFIRNNYGSVWTRTATLTVNTTPDILVQPIDVTVRSGEPASFSVQAQGGTLTYLWLTGNVNWPNNNSNFLSITPYLQSDGSVHIPGANVFKTPAPGVNSVSLWVHIRNQFGGTLSREVNLTVLPATNGGNGGSSGPGATNPGSGTGSQPGSGTGTTVPTFDTFDALINQAFTVSAQRLPRGKKALKQFIKDTRGLLKQMTAARATLEQSLQQLDGMQSSLPAGVYSAKRGELTNAIGLLDQVKPAVRKKLKKAKAKRRRLNRKK